ncbi:MAG: D-Ala-D-Ala carboxypeptidase family metallohydrolase [Bacteroidales bacterium]|nr:D-Ala-D-Ala carboxypeptidase family metallohydrolase [Bacteroidales bacterium]
MINFFYIAGGVLLYKLLKMNYPDKISEHITFAEAIRSNTAIKHGIKNVPNSEQLANMLKVAKHIFEPLRKHFGIPIRVNSFFRSKLLNSKLPFHSKTSQHLKGQAIDLSSMYKSVSNADLFNYIKNNLDFDQLIWELGTSKKPDWVHVSYAGPGKNRKQILRSIVKDGKKMYVKWAV